MAALRSHCRLSLVRRAPTTSILSHRYSTQSYGGGESGYPDSNSAPRRDIEHPGPSAPDTPGTKPKSTSAVDQLSNGPSSTKAPDSSVQDKNPKPAIHRPESAAEADNPEVRKHNKEMRNRADKPMNQLSENDDKVPPNYWKGDVGNVEKSNKR